MQTLRDKGRKRSDQDDGDDESDDDQYDFFESSLESLFGQHQPASGKPGAKYQLVLSDSLTIHYRIAKLQESSNNRLFAHYQWDAGRILALMLCRSTQNGRNMKVKEGKEEAIESERRAEDDDCLSAIPTIEGSHVLELGAGTGLPSLTCAKLGAAKVLITDYPDQGILDAISENVKVNGVQDIASVQGLDWADRQQVKHILEGTHGTQRQHFNLILCADVLWLSTSHSHLLQTISTLLARTRTARVLVLSGFHTGRRALISFFRQAGKQGLYPDWEASSPSSLRGGVFEYNAMNGSTRPWSGAIPFPFPTPDEGDTDRSEVEDDITDNMDDYTERSKWLLFVSLRWATHMLEDT